MDINNISERVGSMRQEIRELRDLNERYQTSSEHTQSDKSEHQTRELRLSQIKQELAGLLKSRR